MTICIPTAGPAGLTDTVYGHFGSAPYFTIVDTDSNHVSVVDRGSHEHEHGTCAPAADLIDGRVNAVACGGMGRKALARLTDAGIRVFLTRGSTPAAAVEEILTGVAEECTEEHACGGHGHHHHA